MCVIPVDDILAVERVEESSFKIKNMFQLVQPNRTLYIQVKDLMPHSEDNLAGLTSCNTDYICNNLCTEYHHYKLVSSLTKEIDFLIGNELCRGEGVARSADEGVPVQYPSFETIPPRSLHQLCLALVSHE